MVHGALKNRYLRNKVRVNLENNQLKKSKVIIRLRAHYFKDSVSCSGNQLSEILQCIKGGSIELDWYIFDMYGSTGLSLYKLFPNYTNPFVKDEQKICMFNHMNELISSVKQIHQFESGVFIGIKKNENVVWDMRHLPETEEDEGIQHPLGLVEIRLFDCSYIEIYGTDIYLIELLKNKFKISDNDLINQ